MADGRSRNDGERPTGDESLEICLLGPFRVVVDGRVVTERQWSRRKPALLIKLLALQPHHQLHREQMIELLWPDSDPESAINNLHKAIHLARHALEPGLKSAADSHFVLTRGQQIVLSAPGKLYIDVEEFERQAVTAIKSNDVAACETAIGLYRGDLLDEDPYEDWAAMRREQSRELFHRLLSNLSKMYEAQGDYHHSIEPLRKLIAADTANEEAHRDLMRLYALTGNRHQALRQYQQCVESLRRELDAQPEPAAVVLHRQIESGLFPPHDTVKTQQTIESIAILPLLNDSGDPEMEYLSDGLTENIINNLSQLPALRVMAWGTVARFKGRETTPAEVGRSLGVRVVLTGRMLQLSERLIVRAELIDAADGLRAGTAAIDRPRALGGDEEAVEHRTQGRAVGRVRDAGMAGRPCRRREERAVDLGAARLEGRALEEPVLVERLRELLDARGLHHLALVAKDRLLDLGDVVASVEERDDLEQRAREHHDRRRVAGGIAQRQEALALVLDRERLDAAQARPPRACPPGGRPCPPGGGAHGFRYASAAAA